MNLGLSIASHSGLSPAAVGELAGTAERAGFGAVFVAEGHGDALGLAGWPRGWRSTGPPGWTCRSSSRCRSGPIGVTSRPSPPWVPRGGTAISEELVIRFFAAIEAGDLGTLREIYAPDAVIWHNDDLLEQSVEDNLKVLQGLHRAVSGLRYDVVRRAAAADGVLQQHVLRGRLPNGTEVELHAAMYLQVRDGHITRIEEYLDSARRAEIRKAREALSG